MKAKVLFLLPYPLHKAPSQRFRVEAYFKTMEEAGIRYDCHCFLNDAAWNSLYGKGSLLTKACGVISGYLRRFFKVFFGSFGYDHIFIHREAAPLGPPVFEWWLAKVLRKKIIYDFDDAIWIANTTESNSIAGKLKCFWKVAKIASWSQVVSAGNAFLAQWSARYNKQVVINPTVVDMETRYDRQQQFGRRQRPVVGWTGSHSTLKYLDKIYPVLAKLQQRIDFDFLVICNQSPAFQLSRQQFIKWTEASEIDDLMQIDIGVMPLEHDAWSEGKCGFKLIQYLALGIPAVASPVGVNKTIVREAVSGYLCETPEEWEGALEKLLNDPALCARFGATGKADMQQAFSLQSNTTVFLSLFQS